MVTPAARALAARFWPGPLSILLVAPRRGTIAFRVPANDLARRLIAACGGGLPVASANRSGEGDSTTAQEVLEQLDGRISIILDGGPTPAGKPSTVVDCSPAPITVLREGPITKAQLEEPRIGVEWESYASSSRGTPRLT